MALRVIVVGGGQVGADLASLLTADGHRVTAIEVRDDVARLLRRDLPDGAVISGNGTDPTVLEAAGIREADVVAAATGADETNLVVTSLARFEFHVPYTIARVNNPKNAWIFGPTMGVDVALNQVDLMAHLVQESLPAKSATRGGRPETDPRPDPRG